LGYPPDFAPGDSIAMQPVLERLTQWADDNSGKQVGVLAESWDIDQAAPSLTWHLRKGVKFHDGTDFNADAVKFNYEQALAAKKLTDGDAIKNIVIVDPYTIKLELSRFNTEMITNFGWGQQVSPTAFKEHGKDWARLNPVGTGPFTVTEKDFVRDTSIKYTKNPNYWRKDAQGNQLPYLDGIETRLITDSMTASATMEAGQADMWTDVSSVQHILSLEKAGLKINWGPGMFWSLLPNSRDTNSPVSKKEVREAIEYAIDRPSLANMIGTGKFEALKQLAPQKMPGYVQGYDPRPYNPAKAKELLAAAGYPNGFPVKLLITSSAQQAAAGIKGYLDAVGIKVTIDTADMGRYFGELFATGFTDELAFAASGINPDGTDLFVHFGANPLTFKTGNVVKSQTYLDLCFKAEHEIDFDKQILLIRDAVKQAGEDAMIIPIYRSVANAVMQTNVHSDYFMVHGALWTPYDDWIEKK
jgi:peptide/nickel transport system substrate-binding protein